MGNSEKKSLAQAMGITRTVIRPREECDIQLREDRIGKYFRKYLNRFVFVEFSDEFIAKSKAGDLMKGVPIPLRKKEVKEFAGGSGIDMLVLAENMAWVMGCDPHFKHTPDYVAILKKLYNYKLYEGMMKEGRDAAERGDMDNACIHFRASLCMQYNYMHSMYSYARACRVMYMNSRNEEYVGRFKAESLDWFELLTETHPRFAPGYYYLGYAYLNMGLYAKANLAWTNFLRFSRNGKDKREIRGRMKQIAEPIEIEKGCNEILAGRYESGIMQLEPFLSSRFNDWWPLYYYLGMAYERIGKRADAVSALRKVLQLNGSHLETMRELLAIYEDEGDKENIKKFRDKIELIESSMKEDQKKQIEETKKEDEKLQKEEPALMEPEHIDIDEADELAASEDHAEEQYAETPAEDASDETKEKKTLVKRFGRKS